MEKKNRREGFIPDGVVFGGIVVVTSMVVVFAGVVVGFAVVGEVPMFETKILSIKI